MNEPYRDDNDEWRCPHHQKLHLVCRDCEQHDELRRATENDDRWLLEGALLRIVLAVAVMAGTIAYYVFK